MTARFQPSEDQRRTAEAMTAYGIPQTDIARVIGIDPKTLRKHFREELDTGAVKANAAVAKTAFEMALSGEKPTMTMFWLRHRAGWKESQVHEHAGKDGEPIELRVRITERAPD